MIVKHFTNAHHAERFLEVGVCSIKKKMKTERSTIAHSARWNWKVLTEKGEQMRDNIMYYPAVVLMIVEAGALAFLIVAWFKAKRRNDDDQRAG
jgi:hypothetical protein